MAIYNRFIGKAARLHWLIKKPSGFARCCSTRLIGSPYGSFDND